jgi:hypothetical protein
MQRQAVEEGEGHSFTSQKIRIFCIMLVGLWLVVFIRTVTCHIQSVPGGMCDTSGECSLC